MMDYIPRTVRSRPNLTQEEALDSLQSHPRFKTGTKIKSLKRRGNVWVATIHEPKTAEFPPEKEKKDEGDSSDGGDDPVVPEGSKDESSEENSKDEKSEEKDSKPSGEKTTPDKKPEKSDDDKKHDTHFDQLEEVVELVHAIADALGVELPDKGIPGGPEESPAPVDGPPGPPPGPPGGGGKPEGGRPPMPEKKPKIGPGDTPPGVTPIGTPAFSSIQNRVATFVAETDDAEGMSIKEAKEELEKLHPPYKVKQAKRVGNGITAILSVR